MLARRPRSPLRAARVLHHASPLDRGALDACAALVVGEHDFGAFTPTATPGARRLRHVTALRVARATATSSCSRSRPTRSCTTWCGRSSGRCCRWGAHARSVDVVRARCSTARRASSPGRRRRRTRSTLSGRALRGRRARRATAIRCYVTRERAGARELLVLERRRRADGARAARSSRCERVDLAAYRVVRAADGRRARERPAAARHDARRGPAASSAHPRGLAAGARRHAPTRGCTVERRRGRRCRFAPLPAALSLEARAAARAARAAPLSAS